MTFFRWVALVGCLLRCSPCFRRLSSSSHLTGKKIIQAPVSRPVGLRRWIDLYASADLVPNGPTRTVEGEHDSKRIWNLHSLFADHTAYWNRDGFVLRVARACAETAGSP